MKKRKDVFVLNLSEKYYELLYRYAKAICCDDTLVEDAVREAFEAAYLKADELQKCPDIEGWLLKAVRYQLLKNVDTTPIPDVKEEEKLSLDLYEKEYDRDVVSEEKKSGKLFEAQKSGKSLKQKSGKLSVKSKLLGLIGRSKNL